MMMIRFLLDNLTKKNNNKFSKNEKSRTKHLSNLNITNNNNNNDYQCHYY